MQFKRLETIPQDLPNSTYIFLVCLQERYAKDFLERGVIRFGQPKCWQKLGDTDGKRGDVFEGVYASMKGKNDECYNLLKSLRNNSHSFERDDRTYFYSDDILQMRAYCMYGFHDRDTHLNEKLSVDHKRHRGGSIPLSYFNGLFDGWTRESYNNCTGGTRPVTLMITPDKFHALVVNRLHELGVRDSEIMFRLINYIDYKGDTFIIGSDKDELFHKHIDFKEQSEVRIVVDTTRDEVKRVFENDGKIDLGPIDPKVAFRLDFYFEDMKLDIGSNHLLFSLSDPIHLPLAPEFLMWFLELTLAGEYLHFPMTIEEIEAEVKRNTDTLREQFGVEYDKSDHSVLYKVNTMMLALLHSREW